MKLILIGPPGAGKGTQAKLICEKYQIAHISTGDILRDNIRRGTELGALAKGLIDDGKLVPDDIILKLIEDRIKQDDCANGYLFDGFPRTIPQAEGLEKMASIDRVVLITSPDNIIVDRITGRRMCECGETYHIVTRPPKSDNACDACGKQLYTRKDDVESVIRDRLATYHTQTKPLIPFYEERGLLVRVNGDQTPDAVFGDISKLLN